MLFRGGQFQLVEEVGVLFAWKTKNPSQLRTNLNIITLSHWLNCKAQQNIYKINKDNKQYMDERIIYIYILYNSML